MTVHAPTPNRGIRDLISKYFVVAPTASGLAYPPGHKREGQMAGFRADRKAGGPSGMRRSNGEPIPRKSTYARYKVSICKEVQTALGWPASVTAANVVYALVNDKLPQRGYKVDHISQDSLNNLPDNLEEVTARENRNRSLANQGVKASRYPGVSRAGATGKWRARITIPGTYYPCGTLKEVLLGIFTDELAAHKAYLAAVASMRPENTPEENARLLRLHVAATKAKPKPKPKPHQIGQIGQIGHNGGPSLGL